MPPRAREQLIPRDAPRVCRRSAYPRRPPCKVRVHRGRTSVPQSRQAPNLLPRLLMSGESAPGELVRSTSELSDRGA